MFNGYEYVREAPTRRHRRRDKSPRLTSMIRRAGRFFSEIVSPGGGGGGGDGEVGNVCAAGSMPSRPATRFGSTRRNYKWTDVANTLISLLFAPLSDTFTGGPLNRLDLLALCSQKKFSHRWVAKKLATSLICHRTTGAIQTFHNEIGKINSRSQKRDHHANEVSRRVTAYAKHSMRRDVTILYGVLSLTKSRRDIYTET